MCLFKQDSNHVINKNKYYKRINTDVHENNAQRKCLKNYTIATS